MYGYICIYRGKRVEIWADTIYGAQLAGAKHFKAKKSYEVHTVLCETPKGSVIHTITN